MPSEECNAATRKEWRALGFYYDYIEDACEWKIAGSVSGLRSFADMITNWASNPENHALGDHFHIGPYSYLKLGVSESPEITDNWIAGPPRSLLQLASTIRLVLKQAKIGDSFRFQSDFAPESACELTLEVQRPSFDPVEMDGLLTG